MEIPDIVITEKELRRNMGERGSRKFIAYKGIVYTENGHKLRFCSTGFGGLKSCLSS